MSVHPFVRRPDEGEAYWFLGNLVTVKAAGAQTGGRLTAVEFVNPPGFAPPLHRHQVEDEMFYLLSGTATFYCDDAVLTAAPGDFVLLPAGLPHTFVVGPDEPLRVLQLTTPAGFEEYVAEVGVPAVERRLPDPAPIDPAALGRAARDRTAGPATRPADRPPPTDPPASTVTAFGAPSDGSRSGSTGDGPRRRRIVFRIPGYERTPGPGACAPHRRVPGPRTGRWPRGDRRSGRRPQSTGLASASSPSISAHLAAPVHHTLAASQVHHGQPLLGEAVDVVAVGQRGVEAVVTGRHHDPAGAVDGAPALPAGPPPHPCGRAARRRNPAAPPPRRWRRRRANRSRRAPPRPGRRRTAEPPGRSVRAPSRRPG